MTRFDRIQSVLVFEEVCAPPDLFPIHGSPVGGGSPCSFELTLIDFLNLRIPPSDLRYYHGVKVRLVPSAAALPCGQRLHLDSPCLEVFGAAGGLARYDNRCICRMQPKSEEQMMKRLCQRCRNRKKRQRVHYKVWVEIEQFDLDTEDGVDMDAPGGALAEFDTYHEAWEFAESLVNEVASSRLPNARR